MTGSEETAAPSPGSLQEENLRLLRLYHESTDEQERSHALAALAERNAGLVRSVAFRYRERLSSGGGGADFEDLIQIGSIGMLKAIRSFDFSYETTFSTYAVPLIIGEIRRFLRDDGTVKVSRELRRRGYLVLQAKEAFQQRMGREPTVSELAHAAGEPQEELVFLLDAASPVHSLSEAVGGEGDGDSFTWEHVLCAEDNEIDRLTDSLSLRQAVASLPKEARDMLHLRYEKQLSQQQTAAILGMTQVRVSRAEKKIFARLREILTERE